MLLGDPGVAPYVCGFVIGSAPQMPGATERYVMEVDDDICGSNGSISMATMIGKLMNLVWEETIARLS